MATRMQQRRGTAAQWVSTNSGNGPILNAGEIGYETDTNKFKIGDGTNHWINLDYFIDANSTVNPAFGSSIVFEGATANAFETTVQVTDPTADRTITLPDATGTVVLADGSGNVTVPGNLTVQGTTTTIDSSTIAVTNSFVFEGATANDYETTLTVAEPTADRTLTLPDATGTVATEVWVVDTAIFTHNNDTTTVHGIEDTTALATKTYADGAVSTHSADTTGVHGIANTADLATTSYADSAVSTHSADTTSVHGITDTAELATKTYADGAASSAVSTHSSDTTSVHGITDTAELATKAYADAAASSAAASAASTHEADTLNVHGIADTSALATTTATASAISTAVSDHNSDTTNVHGISDTSLLVTTTGTQTLTGKTLTSPKINEDVALTATATELNYVDGVTSAVQTQIDAKAASADLSSHTSDTTSVHGIADTADLLLKSGGTMTGALTLSGEPSSSLHAATKQYVDNTASGVVAKPQVLGATTANIDATYSNGTAGVGATLTHNTNGAFPAEAGGASGWAVGKGILVKNQTNKAQNGRYFISNMGSVSTPYVLTRCGYCDEASEIPGAYIFVQDGTSAGTGWIQVVADPATFVVGTDNIDVFQFSGSGTITAGTNISVSGNEVSVVATPSLSGVAFSDGTQTKEGVASRTPIIQKTASYTLSALTERDSLIEMSSSSAMTLTIPTDATLTFPIGTSLDILQTSTGQVTIAGAGGVTVNSTPGLKLRTTWSSATLFKRAADTWVVYGDLMA